MTTVDAPTTSTSWPRSKPGCDVITEKPMTDRRDRCAADPRRPSEPRPGQRVTVAFNYRYNPLHEQVRELLAGGEIGEIGSVHFEWLLDVRHGADYFRRWHRDKANSGGLLVHKASHHFDLVNWWLGAAPVEVCAQGRLFFYGEHGAPHGLRPRLRPGARRPGRGRTTRSRSHLADNPRLRELYLDAEAEDGYRATGTSSRAGVTIEDDMAVLVRYASGATMTYHLTAYSPWEGYRVDVQRQQGPPRARGGRDRPRRARRSPARSRAAALHGARPPRSGHGLACACARSGSRRSTRAARCATTARATAAPTRG